MAVIPLEAAAAGVHPDVVELLLARGARATERLPRGWTVLHEAALLGNERIVRLLLRHGADPFARREDGATPADLARERGDTPRSRCWRVKCGREAARRPGPQ